MKKLILLLFTIFTLSACGTYSEVTYDDTPYVNYEIVWVSGWPYWYHNDIFIPYHHNHYIRHHHSIVIERRPNKPVLHNGRYIHRQEHKVIHQPNHSTIRQNNRPIVRHQSTPSPKPKAVRPNTPTRPVQPSHQPMHNQRQHVQPSHQPMHNQRSNMNSGRSHTIRK